jgi:hypothetical protein
MTSLGQALLSVLLIFCLTVASEARYLKIRPENGTLQVIDMNTYFMPGADHADYCAWPSQTTSNEMISSPACTRELDAQYLTHNNRYLIDDWIYIEEEFGMYGGIITKVDITDLELFVQVAYDFGVWSPDPTDCQDAMMKLMGDMIFPLFVQLGQESNNYEFEGDGYGVHISILCMSKRTGFEYEVCDSVTFMDLFQVSPGVYSSIFSL